MAVDEHLPGEVAIVGLSLFLIVTSISKGHQVIQLKQQNWQQSNPAAQTTSRRTLRSLLQPGDRLPDNLQWSRREVAKEMIPQLLGALFTAGFFTIAPMDISSSSVPVTQTSPLRFFYLFSLFGVILHTLFENIALWMVVEQLFGTKTIRRYKQVHDILLSILSGSTRDAISRNLLLVVDSLWMYMIPHCTFPLFCSYETLPPRLLGTDITCWDNHFHWLLVCLSAYGLMGIFVWSLSMVLRKSNWPTDDLHRVEGIFENADDAEQGLRLQVHDGCDGELAVEMELREAKPPGRSGSVSGWLTYVGWLHVPWRSRALKGVLQPTASPSSFQVLLRQEVEEEPDPQPAVDSDAFWELEGQRALLAPKGPGPEVELELEVEAGTSGGRRRGLRISLKRESELGNPELQEFMGCVGDWKQVAFLTTPHAVEPLPTFVVTILKVVGTLAWSAYVPPHTKEAWRLGIVAFMVCISLAIAAVSHFYRPSVFACVNTLSVVVMFLAVAVSVFSLVHASLVPPGSLSTVVVSWLLWAASAVATVSCLAAVAWTLSEDELWGPAGARLRRLSRWADGLVPFWDVHLGEPGRLVELPVSKWKEGYQKMSEYFGSDDASQIFLHEHGPVRIIEVLVKDDADSPNSAQGVDVSEPSPERSQDRGEDLFGAARLPGGEQPPLCVAGATSKWVLYEDWEKQGCSHGEILSRVLSNGVGSAKEAAEGSYRGHVRVVCEFRSWVSLVAMGKYRQRNNVNLELSTKGQGLQELPGSRCFSSTCKRSQAAQGPRSQSL